MSQSPFILQNRRGCINVFFPADIGLTGQESLQVEQPALTICKTRTKVLRVTIILRSTVSLFLKYMDWRY